MNILSFDTKVRDELDRIRLQIGEMLQDWEPPQPPFGGALVFLDRAAKVLKADPDEALKLLRGCLWVLMTCRND